MSLINDLPEDDRPREKLARLGAGALSDAELLAIFLRVGVIGESAVEIGQRLMQTYGSLSQLSRLSVKAIVKEHGIGPAKASQLGAAFEIASRIARESLKSTPLNNPALIYNAMAPQLRNQSTESLHVMLTDTQLHHIRTYCLSHGTINQTVCHPRDILHPVIQHQAYGFILIHNHPSGNPQPSFADDSMTKRVLEAAEIMQIRFVDHMIIGHSIDGRDPYYSYRESGEIF